MKVEDFVDLELQSRARDEKNVLSKQRPALLRRDDWSTMNVARNCHCALCRRSESGARGAEGQRARSLSAKTSRS